MRGRPGHAQSQSLSGVVNSKAQLALAYQELTKELASERIKVVGNYTLGKVIGEGAYGKVRIGTHRLTSTRVAVKHIPKDLSDQLGQLTREIHHHRRLHHPNVTQLYEVIATENSIWLIAELCSGGELYDYLVEKGRLAELEARRIFGELCLAVHYVHNQGVVHRDLKLENVLLDERCHVKLSDFGFTREFEQNRLMDTYCGTTGYAAPEMIQCKKYLGTEVDVWSLGVILYCLLSGGLPFDDEDEEVMKHKIIYEDYEDIDIVSANARDLIRNLLQKNPAKRLSIPQILAHSWFSKPVLEEPDSQPLPPAGGHVIDLTDDSHPNGKQKLEPIAIPESASAQPSPAKDTSRPNSHEGQPSASSIDSDATFHSATSVLSQSDEGNDLPATPADSSSSHDFARTANSVEGSTDGQTEVPSDRREPSVYMHRMESQSTIRKPMSDKASPVDSSYSHAPTIIPTTVPEEEATDGELRAEGAEDSDSVPPIHPALPPAAIRTRTPVRTKRRSVSSNLTNSPPASPTVSPPPPVPLGGTNLPDFQAQSHLKAPLAFSTDLERNLLSSLSSLGLDTAQIVHSVLTDACDSASAIWWMLKKKSERTELLEARKQTERAKAAALLEKPAIPPKSSARPKAKEKEKVKDVIKEEKESRPLVESPQPVYSGATSRARGTPMATTAPSPEPSKARPPVALMLGQGASASNVSNLGSGPSAPDVTFIPPTPVTLSHDSTAVHTPESGSGRRTPPSTSASFPFNLSVHLQSPGSGNSNPTSPERDKNASKRGSKPRAGSITMLQRATTALTAAGLTRKKSGEAIKEDAASAGTPPLTGSTLRASNSVEDSRPASSSGSQHSHPNKLTKSPPAPKDKDKSTEQPPSLSMNDLHQFTQVHSEITPESPWAYTQAPASKSAFMVPSHRRSVFGAPTPANSPGGSLSFAAGSTKGTSSTGSTVKVRNRASLLAAFRTWFYEDKRKRKKLPALPTIPAGVASTHAYSYGTSGASPRTAYASNSVKSNRPKRPSVSSRRSSSINSRRSSMNSIHHPPLTTSVLSNNLLSRQRSDASRRSLGTRTPTSDRDISSRPSSIRSFSMTPITPGPRVKRHSKSSSASSGGSATPSRRVASPMQQYHRRAGSGSSTRVIRQIKRPNHMRSDSQASSIHSRASSRPGSYHEAFDVSESEGFPRSGSPMISSRRSSEEGRGQYSTTVMVAHRKSSLFGPPSAAGGRSSWKKSWGNEPPTWSNRSLQSPQELPMDPSVPNIRDVFSARPSLSPGDESDWVDEDDDEPTFVGGLGQPPAGHGLATGSLGTAATRPGAFHSLAQQSSGPQPGSPSLKKMEIPPLAGMRNRTSATPSNRSSRPATYKPSFGKSTTPEPVLEEEPPPADTGRPRRQLPGVRSGPAAIQEEDEDEEEE